MGNYRKLYYAGPESWIKVDDIYVSNIGRAKRVCKNGREYLINYRKKSGVMVCKVSGKERVMSHVVWEAFKGKKPDGYVITHINRIKGDDSLSNLALSTLSEHGRKTGPKAASQPVYDREHKKLYPSAREAAKHLFCSYQTVNDCCNGVVKKPDIDCWWYDRINNRIYRGKYERNV